MDKQYDTYAYDEAQSVKKRGIIFIFQKYLYSKQSRKILSKLFYFISGLVSSRACIFGGYYPFGVALTAAVPYENIVFAAIGSLLGCVFPTAVNNEIRYIASILAVVALKWALNDFKALKESIFFAPFIAAAPIFSTGIAMSFLVTGNNKTEIIITIIETLMALASSFFFSSTFFILYSNREAQALNLQQTACTCISICILLLGLSGIFIGPVSLGRILAVFAILFCAKYGRAAGGAIAGSAIGVILSFAGYNVSYLAGSYAFGGLMSGIFSKFGKLATTVVFIMANAIVILQSSEPSAAISCLYEVAIATILFMLLPKEIGDSFGKIFDPSLLNSDIKGLKETVVMRLNFASDTLSDVSSCVEKIACKLKKLYITDMDGVYKESTQNICKHCSQKLNCWEKNFEKTQDAMNNATLKLKDKGSIEKNDFPLYFAANCNNLTDLVNDINLNYQSYLSSTAAQNRVDDIRGVVKEQISFMSDILTDFTQELNTYERFDYALAEQINRVLQEHNLNIKEVSCRVNKNDIMTLEIITPKKGYSKILKYNVIKDIESICKRRFDTPCVCTTEKECRIQITEKPCFYIKSGAYQHICNNARLCGDSYKYFNNGEGKIFAVISDGMGTGGRAAVDSAMASGIFEKLIKAGISMDCALGLVNSSLMVKSGEESIATLDVFSINLFSGEAVFKKAGAAFTYIRHGENIIKIDVPSLPAGILTKIKFGDETMQLYDDDRIIMVSDGVTASGDKWLVREISQWGEENEKEFAQRMIEQAQFRRSDGHDDDITVLAMRVLHV